MTQYDFCRDEIFDRLTPTQIACLTERLCTMFKEIPFTGVIDGINTTFVCVEEIEQIFKNGQLLGFGEPDGYTLSVDRKTATLIVVPDNAFDDKLKFFGNI